MTVVELKIAFHWHCESCGHENFSLPLRREFTEDEARQFYRQTRGLEDYEPLPDGWDQFQVSMIPTLVTCQSCCNQFEATEESHP